MSNVLPISTVHNNTPLVDEGISSYCQSSGGTTLKTYKSIKVNIHFYVKRPKWLQYVIYSVVYSNSCNQAFVKTYQFLNNIAKIHYLKFLNLFAVNSS